MRARSLKGIANVPKLDLVPVLLLIERGSIIGLFGVCLVRSHKFIADVTRVPLYLSSN